MHSGVWTNKRWQAREIILNKYEDKTAWKVNTLHQLLLSGNPKPETWLMSSSYLQKGCDSHCSRKGLWKGACIVVKRPGYHCPLCYMLIVWALATWHIHLFHVRWLATLHLHHKIAETHVRKSFHAPSCAQMCTFAIATPFPPIFPPHSHTETTSKVHWAFPILWCILLF